MVRTEVPAGLNDGELLERGRGWDQIRAEGVVSESQAPVTSLGWWQAPRTFFLEASHSFEKRAETSLVPP